MPRTRRDFARPRTGACRHRPDAARQGHGTVGRNAADRGRASATVPADRKGDGEPQLHRATLINLQPRKNIMPDRISHIVRLALVAAVVLGFGALSLSRPAAAADGKALYTQKICVTCHGADGKAPIQKDYPKLAGQNAAYLVNQIKAFKSGERKGGLSALMAPMAATVSDADAEAIAKYLSTVK
jgi:cytochrome c